MPSKVPTSARVALSADEGIWPDFVYPYSAGIIGGVLGGLVVSAVGIVYGLLTGNIWLPLNLVAASLMRSMQVMPLEDLNHFNLSAAVLGIIVHMTTSICIGATFSFILPALPGRPLFWSLVIGPLLWIAALVAGLPIINPVMVRNLDRTSFTVAMVLYGLVLGWWIDRTPMVQVDDDPFES